MDNGSWYICHPWHKESKKRTATEGFEYNKKISVVKYSPQQPFSNIQYRPDMGVPDEFSDSKIQFFHNLIGILIRTVELGLIDIAYEISFLSCYLAQPRNGNLVQALHIWKYFDQNKRNKLAFDPAYCNVKHQALFQAWMKAMKEM